MQSFRFEKCHSLGNDFVVIFGENEQALTADELKRLADRHRGIGFDQLMWLWADHTSADIDYKARIFNSDGSESGQCMNGLRSVGYLLQSLINPAQSIWRVEVAGHVFSLLKTGESEYGLECDLAMFDLPSMVPLDVDHKKHSVGVVDVGNPHAVWRGEQLEVAQKIAGDTFFPSGVNVGVCSVIDSGRLALQVFERGAGWTLACGSGALAAAWVARHEGWLPADEVVIEQPGGKLKVTWRGDGLTARISGHVAWVFSGEWRG